MDRHADVAVTLSLDHLLASPFVSTVFPCLLLLCHWQSLAKRGLTVVKDVQGLTVADLQRTLDPKTAQWWAGAVR